MMKFMELADDIKRRGVLMPLQFHIKSDGFGVHPRKQYNNHHNNVRLLLKFLNLIHLYIWYKEYVPEFNEM